MNIVYMKLSELHPYENNPRYNENAVAEVARSIKEYGFKNPIVATSDGEIINGHTRYKASKELKLKEVPVIVADDLTKEQIKAFRLADNKTSEYAIWDNKKLLDELADIDASLYTGFDESDVFYDVFDEKDNEPLEENKAGVNYTLKFSTQDEETFEKIKAYIQEVADVER